jgi:Na+-translocating ferredoxin:NAD+ oxidoreductase RnfD subunit
MKLLPLFLQKSATGETENPLTAFIRRGNKFLHTPKGFVLLLLLLLVLIAAPAAEPGLVSRNLSLAILTALLLDIGIVRVFWQRYAFPSGAIITAFIIAMVLSPTVPWYIPVIATLLAIISKHVLKRRRRPLFNPAAFGLIATSFLLPSGQNWWGALATLSPWWIIALLAIGFLVVDRVNKFPQVLAFTASYFGLFAFFPLMGTNTQKIADIFRVPFVNVGIFFAVIMLTDPPTSPATTDDQVLFGMSVAVIGALIYLFFGSLSFLLIALLIGNALLLWKRLWKSGKAE